MLNFTFNTALKYRTKRVTRDDFRYTLFNFMALDLYVKFFISLFIYRIVFLLLLPIVLILLLLRSKTMPAYRQRLAERLGFSLLFNTWKKNGIVLHAASVGEVIAIKSLVEKHLKASPNTPLTITTFTPTGSEQVTKLFGDRVQHCYLPLDNIISTSLFLWALKPKAMVFMETELWPNLLSLCAFHNIKLLLINGRLSAKSMRQYKKLAWLITPSLNLFHKILTQSEDNLKHFLSLGAHSSRCENSGNLKYDISVTPEVTLKQESLALSIESPRKVWLVASTHQGDEELTLKAFKKLYAEDSTALLVIIPRHPERFDAVAKLCEDHEFSLSRRSLKQPVTASTAIWLVDTLGELLPVCALADIVTMGGSFSHIGGHNPLEPALFKKPIIVGPNMSNFKEVLAQLLSAKGIEQLTESNNMSEQLAESVQTYLASPEQGNVMGENAYRVVQSNQGASDKTLTEINALLQ